MAVTPAVVPFDRLADFVNREGASPWVDIAQDTLTAFANATGDHQWIHVDAERARREAPYGTTIAHGFLTLSLMSRLMREAIRFEGGPRFTINYGLNKVRFPAPLPAGSRVRGRFTLLRVDAAPDGSWQAAWAAVIEREGSDKPCCAAEWLVRYYP